MPRCPSCHRRLVAGANCPRDGAEVGPAPPGEMGEPPIVPGFVLDGAPLGSGGFATTWPAVRSADGRHAAIKVSRVPSLAAAARLAREAEALARVGAPVVPELFEHGRMADGRAFLAMERIEAPLLSDLMLVPELLPGWRVGQLASLLCPAVAAIHRAGEAHGDLKPENLFVGPGQMRVIDFGGAAATPEYAAPEQMRGGEAGRAADAYAVGAILYELLTGRPPFVGDLAAIEYGVRSLRPAPPSTLAEVPPAVDAIVMACLEKDPARRPVDLAGLGMEVEAACREKTGDGQQATGNGRRATVAHTQVVVIAAVKGGSAEAIVRRRGIVVGPRGECLVCAFTPDAVADPVKEGRRAAEEMIRAGIDVALHLAPVVVRARASGPPLLVGAALDPASWAPAGWSGLFVSEALVAAERASVAVPRFLGRAAELAAARASFERVLAESRPGLFTVVGGPGAGSSRLLREIALAIESSSPEVALVTAPDPAFADGDQLRELARARPLALVLDDVQHLDDRLLSALDYAALDGAGVPLWIAVGASAELAARRPDFGARARHHDRVALGPLAEADAMRLAAHLLEPAEYPPEDALRRIAQMADCRPLALVELCRALADRGLIRRGPGGGHYLATAELEALPASPSIEWLAGRELERLTPELAALARLCAALLPGFDRDQVDAVSRALQRGSAAPAVDSDLGLFQLRSRGLITVDESGRMRMASSALAAGIERGLDPGERERIHRHALDHGARTPGRGLAAIAHHAGALGASDEAAAAYLALAEEAARQHRTVDADRQFSAALAHAQGPSDLVRARALFGRGRMRYRIGRAGDALADLEEAERSFRAAGELRAAVDAVFEQATALDWANDYRQSAARAALAVAEAAPLADPELEARSAMARGRSAWRAGEVGEAAGLLTLAAEAAAAAGDTDTRTVALVLLGPVLVRAGDLAAAESRFDEALTLCRAAGDRVHLCAVHVNRMFLWSARKQPDLARADLRAAAHLARQIGHPEPERNASYNLAEDLYWSGEDDREALDLARRSRFLQRRFLARPAAEDSLLIARIAIALGDEPAAREAIGWVEEEVPEAERSPASRVFLRLVLAWLDAAPAATWSTLVADATGTLAPDDRLEVLYWAARAAGRSPDRDLLRVADRARQEAAACLDEAPIWRHRFENL